MSQKKYTLNEVIREAMTFYEVKIKDPRLDATRFRKKFENYLKNTLDNNGISLWEKSIDHDYEFANKKSFHFFTSDQMMKIIGSDEIYDYMKNESSNSKIKELPSRAEIMDDVYDSHKRWNDFQQETGMPDYHYVGITPKETDLWTLQINIMLEALFNLFFEPLKIELLTRDYDNSCLYGGNTETFQTMYSKLRLRDYTNYYSPKKDLDSLTNQLLDILVEKIAKKLNDKGGAK